MFLGFGYRREKKGNNNESLLYKIIYSEHTDAENEYKDAEWYHCCVKKRENSCESLRSSGIYLYAIL